MEAAALRSSSDTYLEAKDEQNSFWTPPRRWIRTIALLFPALVIGVVIAQPWADPRWFFLDPLAAAEISGDCCHSYYGFVSNLGVMLWTATSAICLFAAIFVVQCSQDLKSSVFLVSAGVLTGWLALDDVFLLHEAVFPSFGLAQNAILAFYTLIGGFYAIASWRKIWSADVHLFAMAVFFLGTSILVDVVFHSTSSTLVVIEDAAKFAGISFWAVFHVTTALHLLGTELSAMSSAPKTR